MFTLKRIHSDTLSLINFLMVLVKLIETKEISFIQSEVHSIVVMVVILIIAFTVYKRILH